MAINSRYVTNQPHCNQHVVTERLTYAQPKTYHRYSRLYDEAEQEMDALVHDETRQLNEVSQWQCVNVCILLQLFYAPSHVQCFQMLLSNIYNLEPLSITGSRRFRVGISRSWNWKSSQGHSSEKTW